MSDTVLKKVQGEFPGLTIEDGSRDDDFIVHPPSGSLWAARNRLNELLVTVNVTTYHNSRTGELTIIGITY